MACKRNPSLGFCKEVQQGQDNLIFFDFQTSLNEKQLRKRNYLGRLRQKIRQTIRYLLLYVFHLNPFQLSTEIRTKQLRGLCQKFYPLASRVRVKFSLLTLNSQHCTREGLQNQYVAKCASYFRDCQNFLIRGDPLAAIGESFSSGVGITPWMFEVKGVPYYPINEEGAFGAGYNLNVPFGTWGGGYSQNLGVRQLSFLKLKFFQRLLVTNSSGGRRLGKWAVWLSIWMVSSYRTESRSRGRRRNGCQCAIAAG